MSPIDITKIIFLGLTHTYIWYGWSKADFYAARRGLSIFSARRIFQCIIPATITLLSIIVVDYPVPKTWGWRILIDGLAIGIIVCFRWRLWYEDKKSSIK